eukprot:7545940-Pyramimonas_sp.AAC.1
MHRLTKLKRRWTPTTIETHPGIFSANPRDLLEAESEAPAKFWHASAAPSTVWVPNRNHLPRPTAGDIRSASASFSALTSQSLDGLHPRQLSLVSDAALDTFGALVQAIESLG